MFDYVQNTVSLHVSRLILMYNNHNQNKLNIKDSFWQVFALWNIWIQNLVPVPLTEIEIIQIEH
jgi:hypothetical protein